MKLNQSTFAAAAVAGLFAAGTAMATIPTSADATTSAISGEKEKCTGKDGCKGKDKEKDKEKCSGKDGCKGKDKKEDTIL